MFSRWASELLSLLGGDSWRHVGLLDLNVAPQLIGLQDAHVALREGDGVLDSVAKLNVVEVMKEIAELKLDAFVNFHGEDALAVFVFAVCGQIEKLGRFCNMK